MSLLRLASVVLAEWKLLLLLPFLGLVIVALWALLSSRKYTVHAAFLPQAATSSLSGAAGLAARFGVALPQADPSQAPAFWGSLVKSREILRQLATARYLPEGGADSAGLVALMDLPGETPAEQVEEAVLWLREVTDVTLEPETNVIRIRVSTTDPALSVQISQRILDAVNDFNLRQRQARAAAERRFAEERVAEAAGDLRAAEDALQEFLSRNRQFQASPQLAFEHDRLQRAVAMRQEVYTALVQSLNNAHLEENRNTPLIMVTESPRTPAYPDRRYLLFKGMLAILVGVVVASALAILRAGVRTAAEQEPDVARRFTELRTDILRRRWRRAGGAP